MPERWFRLPVEGTLSLRSHRFTLRSIITKRERILDGEGLWVDTVPLVLLESSKEEHRLYTRTVQGMPAKG